MELEITLEIEFDQQPIELYKLLKVADLVSGGGEAKIVISEGYVYLNGELETQKRKKVFNGDVVSFNDEHILMICHNEPVEKAPRPRKPKQANTSKNQSKGPSKPVRGKNKPKPANQPSSSNNKLGKRRPINF